MPMPYFSGVVKKLWILTALLALLNIIVVSTYGMYERRVVRCVSVGVLLCFYFYYNRQRSRSFLLFFSIFFIKDFGMIFYDTYWGNSFYFLFGAIGYGVYAQNIAKNAYFTLDRRLMLGSLLLLLLGGLIVYLLIENLSIGFVAHLNIPLFICYGILSVIVALCTFQYNSIYNSRRSFWFVCVALLLTVSDLFRYIAFYFSLDLLSHFEKLCYLLAWALLIYISLHPILKQEEKQDISLLEEEVKPTSDHT